MSAKTKPLAQAATQSLGQSTFAVELCLSVTDTGALWSAAVEKGLGSPGATLDDLVDVLGPREDPDLSACLVMLTAPAAIPGCRLRDFNITRQSGKSAFKAAANDPAALRARLDASA